MYNSQIRRKHMSPTQFIDQGFITPDCLGFSSILSQQAMAIWASQPAPIDQGIAQPKRLNL